MNFVMTGSGKFIEVQGTAESEPFTRKQMERMAEIAQARYQRFAQSAEASDRWPRLRADALAAKSAKFAKTILAVIELLVATTNSGKFAEVQAFLSRLPIRIRSLRDLANPPTVVEDGATFEANALKKARSLAEYSGLLTLADDSGLEVDVLGGAPGIYSARYCGEEGNDDENNRKLLRELAGVAAAQRSGAFRLRIGAVRA